MRIAHREHGDFGHFVALQGQAPQGKVGVRADARLGVAGVKGNEWPFKHRLTHVYPDAAIGLFVQGDDAALDFDPHFGFVSQASFFDETDKTARAIAALLDFAAVGVVDDVFEISLGRGAGAHAQDLIGPDTEVPVSQKTILLGGQMPMAAGLVKDHEIVTGSLHFGERHSHGPHY